MQRLLGGFLPVEMEGGEFVQVGFAALERNLGIPDLEGSSGPDQQGELIDARAPAHQFGKDNPAGVDVGRLDKPERAPRPCEMKLRRDRLLGDPPSLDLGMNGGNETRVIGDEAGIAFMAADKEPVCGGAETDCLSDECRKQQSTGSVDDAYATAAEEMFDHILIPRGHRRYRIAPTVPVMKETAMETIP